MEHTHNTFLAVAVVLFCTCVAAALPAGRSGDAMQGDLSHLVTLIGKLKNLNSHRNNLHTAADNWAVLAADDSSSESLNPSSSNVASSSSDKMASLKQGFLGFQKRQGAWSYDYGLGGGRFGKRYYGDYGIGGGRFGRDVDHVDIADTNDASL